MKSEKEHLFVFLSNFVKIIYSCALTVQRLIGERKWGRHLQEVGKVRRGPKGSLTTFQRVSQCSDLEKPLT